jgi:hypothetical protein
MIVSTAEGRAASIRHVEKAFCMAVFRRENVYLGSSFQSSFDSFFSLLLDSFCDRKYR